MAFPTGTAAGASTITGAAIRKVFPSGAISGTSAIAGAAIRVVLPTGTLVGVGSITGQGKRIVWMIGTLTGAAPVVIGIPTTRIFAPAWGNSSTPARFKASDDLLAFLATL